MADQLLARLRMFVGRVVVDDGVDRFSCRHLGLDGILEADELLVPMSPHVAADDGAVENVVPLPEGENCLRNIRPSSSSSRRWTRICAVPFYHGVPLTLKSRRAKDYSRTLKSSASTSRNGAGN